MRRVRADGAALAPRVGAGSSRARKQPGGERQRGQRPGADARGWCRAADADGRRDLRIDKLDADGCAMQACQPAQALDPRRELTLYLLPSEQRQEHSCKDRRRQHDGQARAKGMCQGRAGGSQQPEKQHKSRPAPCETALAIAESGGRGEGLGWIRHG